MGVPSPDVLDVDAVEAVDVMEGVRRCDFVVAEMKLVSTGLEDIVGSGVKGRLITS